jgi:tryptophan-rich sensory protein
LRKGPLFVAVAIPALFALLGGVLAGGSGVAWFAELTRPWFLVPLWMFYLVGLVYYVGGAVVLYRVLVHVDDRGGGLISLALIICVMLLNELWNYLFFGLRSPLAGFLGIVVFLVPLTALLLALRRYERFSAALVAVYYLWVLYDLAWTYQLWRLNDGT